MKRVNFVEQMELVEQMNLKDKIKFFRTAYDLESAHLSATLGKAHTYIGFIESGRYELNERRYEVILRKIIEIGEAEAMKEHKKLREKEREIKKRNKRMIEAKDSLGLPALKFFQLVGLKQRGIDSGSYFADETVERAERIVSEFNSQSFNERAKWLFKIYSITDKRRALFSKFMEKKTHWARHVYQGKEVLTEEDYKLLLKKITRFYQSGLVKKSK